MSLDIFNAYAIDFEKTFADEDWSRLERHFAADAVYAVENAPFGCRVEGVGPILAALRKSVDGFDRKMASRTIAVTGQPTFEDGEFSVEWTVTYTKAGAPDYQLRGATTARFENGRISLLVDRYADGVGDAAVAWANAHAPGLDLSYV